MSEPASDKIPNYVKTQSDLASLLGVHRNTIVQWCKEADCPQMSAKGYDVRKWLEWAPTQAKRANIDKSDRKKQLEIEKLEETVRGLKLGNDKQDGLLVPMAKVQESITALASEFNQEVRRIEDGLPQALQGLGLPEQRLKIREMFDSLRLKIHKGVLSITNQ